MAWPPPVTPMAVLVAEAMAPPPDARFTANWAAAREKDVARRAAVEARWARGGGSASGGEQKDLRSEPATLNSCRCRARGAATKASLRDDVAMRVTLKAILLQRTVVQGPSEKICRLAAMRRRQAKTKMGSPNAKGPLPPTFSQSPRPSLFAAAVSSAVRGCSPCP